MAKAIFTLNLSDFSFRMDRKQSWTGWLAHKCLGKWFPVLLVVTVVGLISQINFLSTAKHLRFRTPVNTTQLKQSLEAKENVQEFLVHRHYVEEIHTNLINLTTRKSMHHLPGIDLYVYSAFLDDRFSENVVRIFGLLKKNATLPEFRCRWKTIGEEIDVPARNGLVDDSWPSWSDYFASYFVCNFTKPSYPDLIQLTSIDERYAFSIPVEQTVRLEKRKELALCIKPIEGVINTAHLIEWFEAQRASGVKDILMYTTIMLGSNPFIVQYYKDMGLVKTLPFPYLSAVLQTLDTPPMSREKKYAVIHQVYLIALQDCLYRFYGSYENLILLDLDEVMLPSLPYHSLGEMVTYLHKYHIGHSASFLLMTAWHFDDFGFTNDAYIPRTMYMARVTKATRPTLIEPKGIIITDRTIYINFHAVVEPKLSNRITPDTIGYIHRFRSHCSSKFQQAECNGLKNSVTDDPILPFYRMIFVQNAVYVQKKLGLQ